MEGRQLEVQRFRKRRAEEWGHHQLHAAETGPTASLIQDSKMADPNQEAPKDSYVPPRPVEDGGSVRLPISAASIFPLSLRGTLSSRHKEVGDWP